MTRYCTLLKEERTVTTRDFKIVNKVLSTLILDFVSTPVDATKPEEREAETREGLVHKDKDGVKGPSRPPLPPAH